MKALVLLVTVLVSLAPALAGAGPGDYFYQLVVCKGLGQDGATYSLHVVSSVNGLIPDYDDSLVSIHTIEPKSGTDIISSMRAKVTIANKVISTSAGGADIEIPLGKSTVDIAGQEYSCIAEPL